MSEYIQRLATMNDKLVIIEPPITATELTLRNQSYQTLAPKKFVKQFLDLWDKPIEFQLDGNKHIIQVNRCTNPFCRWYGEPQFRFETVKYKPYKYKLDGAASNDECTFMCNPDPLNTPSIKKVQSDSATIYSNWSLADEIARLVTINSLKAKNEYYNFHKEKCYAYGSTPDTEPKYFSNYGFSKAKGQRFKCKSCGKVTTISPKSGSAANYEQNKVRLMPMFAKAVVSRIPVKKCCELFSFGPGTFYHKLEFLYKSCLHFLERHETAIFKEKQFDKLWISSDSLQYQLNPLRKVLQKSADRTKELQTHIVASADNESRYVFRADVNFDYLITLDKIAEDTVLYKEDHLYNYQRKNARLRVPYQPQAPTDEDVQTDEDFLKELKDFDNRRNRYDGLHVSLSYTTMAHFWLLRQMVKSKEWVFITDNAPLPLLYRIFASEFKDGWAHSILQKIDRDKDRKNCLREYFHGDPTQGLLRLITKLLRGPSFPGRMTQVYNIAFDYLREIIELAVSEKTSAINFGNVLGTIQLKKRAYIDKPQTLIKHPFPTRDYGYREVGFTSDINNLDIATIANMLLRANMRGTDAFFQMIHRSINTLERPLVAAKPGQKTYIYTNLNPRYAQYLVTILRTYYNFCMPITYHVHETKTPAQFLGIADRQFEIEDILYFR